MFIAGLVGALLTGCGDGGDPPLSVDAGTDPLPLPPIPGGGTTGGSILGRLVVYVLARGEAVPGTPVTIDTPTGRVVRVTNGDGRIEVVESGLRGPATITAFAANGPYYTLAGVDAAGVSLDLLSMTSTPAAEAHATGAVEGWAQLTPPANPSVELWAEVRPIVRSLIATTANLPQSTRIDAAFAENVVVPDPPLDAYRLRLDATNTFGVFARAGRGPTVGEAPNAFEYLAVANEVTFTAGATVTANLSFLVPLDQRLDITTDRRPALPFIVVAPVWQLSNGGRIAYANTVAVSEAAPDVSVMAPDPSAQPGSELGAVGLAQDERGQRTARWFRTLEAETSMPAFIDIPTPSRTGPRAMTAAGRAGDLMQWILLKDGQPVWRMDVVGPARQEDAVWPTVAAGLTDPVPGDASVAVTSFDFGDFDPDQASFNQLTLLLRGLATGFQDLQF